MYLSTGCYAFGQYKRYHSYLWWYIYHNIKGLHQCPLPSLQATRWYEVLTMSYSVLHCFLMLYLTVFISHLYQQYLLLHWLCCDICQLGQLMWYTRCKTNKIVWYCFSLTIFGIIGGDDDPSYIYRHRVPDSKVHGVSMGPIWGRLDPGGPHVGPMNFAISDDFKNTLQIHVQD